MKSLLEVSKRVEKQNKIKSLLNHFDWSLHTVPSNTMCYNRQNIMLFLWNLFGFTIIFIFYFLFYGCTNSIWKSWGQRLNPSYSCHLHLSYGNAGSFNPTVPGQEQNLHLRSKLTCCNYFPAILSTRRFLGSTQDMQQLLRWTGHTNSSMNVPAGTRQYIFQRK